MYRGRRMATTDRQVDIGPLDDAWSSPNIRALQHRDVRRWDDRERRDSNPRLSTWQTALMDGGSVVCYRSCGTLKVAMNDARAVTALCVHRIFLGLADEHTPWRVAVVHSRLAAFVLLGRPYAAMSIGSAAWST